MPKACIYAGFRHLFYRMALLWLYLLGGVMISNVYEYEMIGGDYMDILFKQRGKHFRNNQEER